MIWWSTDDLCWACLFLEVWAQDKSPFLSQSLPRPYCGRGAWDPASILTPVCLKGWLAYLFLYWTPLSWTRHQGLWIPFQRMKMQNWSLLSMVPRGLSNHHSIGWLQPAENCLIPSHPWSLHPCLHLSPEKWIWTNLPSICSQSIGFWTWLSWIWLCIILHWSSASSICSLFSRCDKATERLDHQAEDPFCVSFLFSGIWGLYVISYSLDHIQVVMLNNN